MTMKLQIKDGKSVQVERYFPSNATEGPAISELRGISAKPDCPKIIYADNRTKGVYRSHDPGEGY